MKHRIPREQCLRRRPQKIWQYVTALSELGKSLN
jgi:hypothetical protein